MKICHFQDHAIRVAVIPIVEVVRQDGRTFQLRLLCCLLVAVKACVMRGVVGIFLAAANDSPVSTLLKLGIRLILAGLKTEKI